MKKTIIIFTFAILGVLIFNHGISAQSKTVAPPVQRDLALEQDAQKNLEIARQYFSLKKAYKAVVLRLDEVIAAYPQFSKMDEVLYLYSMSSLYLSENKGKQKVDLKKSTDKDRFAPEKLREDAIANLNLLVQKFPDSEFTVKAKKILKEIDK